VGSSNQHLFAPTPGVEKVLVSCVRSMWSM
jgi:hypothetical protein